MENKIQYLISIAKKASQNSYSPYSKFPVGSALEDVDGNVFAGCNVENLSFPSGLCAERTAVCKAVTEVGPKVKIKTLVTYTPSMKVTPPCGACRQVINEFAIPNTRVLCVCDSDSVLDVPFKNLLPEPPLIDDLK